MIFCRWLDSNRGPLESEATTLPTEPQQLPKLTDISDCSQPREVTQKQISTQLTFGKSNFFHSLSFKLSSTFCQVASRQQLALSQVMQKKFPPKIWLTQKVYFCTRNAASFEGFIFRKMGKCVVGRCNDNSVTRLGEFWKFLVTNFLLKSIPILGGFLGFF